MNSILSDQVHCTGYKNEPHAKWRWDEVGGGGGGVSSLSVYWTHHRLEHNAVRVEWRGCPGGGKSTCTERA